MPEYIIITGGELFNKGAQAMTFITVDEIAKRFQGLTPVVISGRDAERRKDEREQYNFIILTGSDGWSKTELLSLGGALTDAGLCRSVKRASTAFSHYIENAVLWLDISGYAIGSNWGAKKAIKFMLSRVAVAKAYGIPFYFMPQSFGPLNFKGWKGALADYYLKKYLPYARTIYAREQEGLEQLQSKYRLTNVCRSNDLVLQNMGIELKNIYKELKVIMPPETVKHSVAVIPNQQNIRYGHAEELYTLYASVIREVIENGKSVYLIYHAAEDLEICREIKHRYFETETRVILIEQELSCIDFDELVAGMDFVIASRFHAIVHAYRRGVPSVTLGWATKYRELLALFGQERFQFDVREKLDENRVLTAVSEMLEHHGEESEKIRTKLAQVQKENVFDDIFRREPGLCG